jgi:hypothetical protein
MLNTRWYNMQQLLGSNEYDSEKQCNCHKMGVAYKAGYLLCAANLFICLPCACPALRCSNMVSTLWSKATNVALHGSHAQSLHTLRTSLQYSYNNHWHRQSRKSRRFRHTLHKIEHFPGVFITSESEIVTTFSCKCICTLFPKQFTANGH